MSLTEQRLLDKYQCERLNTAQLAEALSFKGAHSVLQSVHNGTFPVRTYLIGKRRYADISDVASYLDQQKAVAA